MESGWRSLYLVTIVATVMMSRSATGKLRNRNSVVKFKHLNSTKTAKVFFLAHGCRRETLPRSDGSFNLKCYLSSGINTFNALLLECSSSRLVYQLVLLRGFITERSGQQKSLSTFTGTKYRTMSLSSFLTIRVFTFPSSDSLFLMLFA